MNKNDITYDDFMSYENVRLSGVINMFHITYICILSGLERERVLCIVGNYTELKDKYLKK